MRSDVGFLTKREEKMYFVRFVYLLCLSFYSTTAVADNSLYTKNVRLVDAEKIVEQFMANKEYLVKTTLCGIMNQCGSDKASAHNYTTLYSKLFAPYIDLECNVFELGLGTNYLDMPSNMGIQGIPGASLFGWATYFPKAHIYGADIDKRILFSTSRIETYYCDETSAESVQKMYNAEGLRDIVFDIIVEDGLHSFSASYNFLVNSLSKLREGGLFIIEDLSDQSVDLFEQEMPYLKKDYNLSYFKIIKIPIATNRNDNVVLVIQK